MQRWISRVHGTAVASRTMPVLLRYVVTIALVGLVVWIQLTWGEDAGNRYPFLAFIPVIFVAGAFLDRGNGFFATVLSALAVSYYFLYPRYWIAVLNPSDQIALALFVVIGFAISSVVEALHVGLVSFAIEHERATAAVRDRDVLLNELSHRTRNDFANVVTLLNLQSRSANQEAREALLSAAERVQTIARVHRRLELRDDHVVVDTKSYLGELCADLRLSRLAMRPIAIECRAESHSISLEKAVPLGLIINESVTNATKHAFPDQKQGTIVVNFQRSGEVYKLVVADNGVGQRGVTEQGTSAQPLQSGIGNRLMGMLAAQLGSKMEVEDRSPGTAIVVTIPVKTVK
ncbi:sensor histidine kinase [Hyphomicrobium sp. 99]|uniref:sensor histidine kinase n=1 Tax=Hyphomicrobium sp. 99 TaxID=1163419 RepID=UPI0006983FE1|nr:histidine kinase dimerization/phosphoacceptor domain -containing protein [Hyphomicrobium sp. 99]